MSRYSEPFVKQSVGTQPITHRGKHVKPQFEQMKASGALKGKFRTPKGLTILTCHDYDFEPILEQNLKFLGLEYKVLRETRKPFKYVYKIERLLQYMKANPGNLILFMDAFDVIVRDNPEKIIEVFRSKNCKLLFASTMFKGGWVCMPDIYKWYLENATPKRGHYLNSGVFIGEWDFTIKFLEEARKYIVPWSLTKEEYLATGRGDRGNKRLCERLPNYPVGAPDQDIFRYIHPLFFPDMQVDHKNQLVYRN